MRALRKKRGFHSYCFLLPRTPLLNDEPCSTRNSVTGKGCKISLKVRIRRLLSREILTSSPGEPCSERIARNLPSIPLRSPKQNEILGGRILECCYLLTEQPQAILVSDKIGHFKKSSIISHGYAVRTSKVRHVNGWYWLELGCTRRYE